MDKTALFSLSYGVYIISTKDAARPTGCVANSVIQVSANPATVAVSLNKDNFTTDCVLKTGGFTVSVLAESAPPDLIGTFGFHSGRDTDKFANTPHDTTADGLPAVTNGVCAFLSCRVIGTLDAGTHTIILGEVTDAGRRSDEAPMTYAYYHKVIKGKAPKNAPTYVEEEPPKTEAQYVCTVCGYVYPGSAAEFEALPDDWKCPLCNAPKALFEKK